MKKLFIKGTEDAPQVVLDPEEAKFELSGKSMPEDVSKFYQPILDWITEYVETVPGKMVFDFKLIYFNTASSKLILDILLILEEMIEKKQEALVRWHYHIDDEDMLEAGEEYAEMVDVPFEYLEYK